MMTKKILLGLGLCSLLAFPAVNAKAETQGFCSNGQVVMAGSFSGGKVVQIRNTRTDCGTWPNGATRVFFLDNTNGQASGMLAAALAAQAAGSPVLIQSQSAVFANASTLVLLYAQGEAQP